MLYIICAFEAEARVLIDAYKLIKEKNQDFTLFSNEEIILLISNMGQENAQKAAQYLLSRYTITQEDAFVNLGICAAKESYPIGKLLQVCKLENKSASYSLFTQNKSIQKVSCFSSAAPVDEVPKHDIAEMEAISLYESLYKTFDPKKLSFLKVVSDHFQPEKFKKSFIIQLMQKNIKAIKHHIDQLKGTNNEK